MAFGTQDGNFADSGDEVMSEINMTPLVDVMLVLLIVFIITVPVMKHAVNIDLPRAASQPQDKPPASLRLSIQANGQYLLNELVSDDATVQQQLQNAAAQTPQPELHIHGDKAVRYERVAQAMAAAQQAGLHKIGFVTDPSTLAP
jgi:biopolymer transport protein ExbD